MSFPVTPEPKEASRHLRTSRVHQPLAALQFQNCDNDDGTCMTIELKSEHAPLVAMAIKAGLIETAEDVVDVGIEVIRCRMEARTASDRASRQEAVRRMQEFADKYRLTLGEPITRNLLHEGHRH